MTNRVNLAQLRDMTAEQAASLPIDQIAMLLEDIDAEKASLKTCDDLIYGAMMFRFADRAALAREAKGTNTGTITLAEGEYDIRADLPKRVEWDQGKLAHAIEAIRSWGEDPTKYVSIEIKVAESRYNAWPTPIRSLFEPARTVGTGRPIFKVERAKRRAA